MHLSVRSFAVLMGLAVVASACGGADSGAPSTTVTEAATTTTVEANTTTSEAAAAPVTVEIEAFDYGFSGFDTELKVGDTLELFNSSASEYHSLIVIRSAMRIPSRRSKRS
jgi:ABC-type glycerol-3-phosphate transport system substrate-binding protein